MQKGSVSSESTLANQRKKNRFRDVGIR